MTRVACLLLVLAFLGLDALAASASGCRGKAVSRIGLVLDTIGYGTLNEVSGAMGFFQLTNSSAVGITLPGWVREGTLWLEYPVATIQVKDGSWKDVTPMIGSFLTDGSDKETVAPGKSLRVAARLDFGVPVEARKARLVINLPNETCVISSPFSLPARR